LISKKKNQIFIPVLPNLDHHQRFPYFHNQDNALQKAPAF